MSGPLSRLASFSNLYSVSLNFTPGRVLAANLFLGYFYLKFQENNSRFVFSLSRELSRVYGYLFHLELPEFIQPYALNAFVSVFGVNLEEIEKPLTDYKSMNDFFTRKLKPGSRKIEDSPLVSPCDSRVMSFGYAGSLIMSVKGSEYSLSQLVTGDKDSNYQTLRKVLLKNPNNELYYITLYLAPYDYHRFHSPTDFQVQFRRHIYGYMQGVFPWNLSRKSDVFATNERIVYSGEWMHGSLVYIPVAAFNVGDISIGPDPELKTNLLEFENWEKLWNDKNVDFSLKKGDEIGMFNAGSTIIMVFEAPRYLIWNVEVGDKVWMGNSLVDLNKVQV